MSGSRKKGEIRRVVLYARVSTTEQAEKDLSLPAQLDAMRKFCQVRGYEVAADYVEPGASGTDENRKVFKRMMEDVLAPSRGINAILVYQTSRFMRNATKARVMKDMLRKHGIRVIAIGQETADDPMGRIIEGIFELIDQYESEVNGMRTAAAMRENAKQGYFNGSQPPYGYKKEKKEANAGVSRSVLVPDPRESEILQQVFRLYIGGTGAVGVARDLNQRGLRYRSGTLWNKNHVLKVIEESAPAGTFYWGKRDTKTGALNDREDWIPIQVEAVIDPDLFDMAQRVRASRDPATNPGRTGSSPLLLAGLLKCGKCGASYQLETSGKPTKGLPYRYYNCRSKVRTGKEACPGFRVRTEVLDKAILDHVAEKLFTPERCRLLLQDLVEETGILRQKTAEQRRQIQNELADIERRIATWEDAFERGALPAESGADKVLLLKAKRTELVQTLGKIVPLKPPPAHLYSDASIERFRSSIRDIFLGGSHAIARNYLRFLVERIVITDNKIELVAKAGAALQAMAGGQKNTEVSAGEPVLTSVVDWLRGEDSNLGPGD